MPRMAPHVRFSSPSLLVSTYLSLTSWSASQKTPKSAGASAGTTSPGPPGWWRGARRIGGLRVGARAHGARVSRPGRPRRPPRTRSRWRPTRGPVGSPTTGSAASVRSAGQVRQVPPGRARGASCSPGGARRRHDGASAPDTPMDGPGCPRAHRGQRRGWMVDDTGRLATSRGQRAFPGRSTRGYGQLSPKGPTRSSTGWLARQSFGRRSTRHLRAFPSTVQRSCHTRWHDQARISGHRPQRRSHGGRHDRVRVSLV